MWKKNRRIELLGLLAFFMTAPAAAQQPLSLRTLVSQALEKNYQVQIVKNEAVIAQNNNTPGNAGFWPSVTLSGEQSLRVENTRTDFYNGETRTGSNAQSTALNAMVEMNWKVFDGMKMFARKDRLGFLQKLGSLDTRFYLEQTAADLGKAYYQLIKERHLLKAYRKSLHISAYRLRLQDQKRNVGAAGTLAYNQARVDYNTDSALVAEKATQIDNLEIRINELINRSLTKALDTRVDTLAPSGIKAQQILVDSALAANVELQQAHVRSLVADAERRVQLGDRYPEVSVFGRYGFSRQTSESGFLAAGQNYGPAFGVQVRFNLFNGGKERREIRNAEIRKENSQLEKSSTRQMIRAGVIRNYNTYKGLQKQYQISRQSLDAAQQSLQIAEKQLAEGAIDGNDFRRTQERLIQTRIRVVELQYALKATELDLQRLTGNLLEELLH